MPSSQFCHIHVQWGARGCTSNFPDTEMNGVSGVILSAKFSSRPFDFVVLLTISSTTSYSFSLCAFELWKAQLTIFALHFFKS